MIFYFGRRHGFSEELQRKAHPANVNMRSKKNSRGSPPPPLCPDTRASHCATEAKLIMSTTKSHLHSRASHPRKHTHLYLCFGGPVRFYDSDTTGLIHTKSEAASHLRLQTQHAMRVNSKNCWCAANCQETSGTHIRPEGGRGPPVDRYTSVLDQTYRRLTVTVLLLKEPSFQPLTGNTAPTCGATTQKHSETKQPAL